MSKTQATQLLLCATILFQSCAIVGCHRSYYRRQADVEAQRLILQKSADPRWDSATGNIDVDPQSRMFNPFSQDHPPIPPDDPTSHEFLHRVDGKDGYPHWHANGDTEYVENPVWLSYLPMNEKQQVVLNLSSAYQLALIHSPTLQQQRESLYLSALDVSLERFGFDSQLFAGFNNFLETQGRFRNGGTSSTTLTNSLGANGGGINARRLGITGTNFAVGLANTIMWNFAGNNTQSSSSLIDFSIIQPLLRGAGRDRILESLTQTERTLLANVRQLERFRRGFYLQIATGRNPGQGVSTNSGAFLGTPGTSNGNPGGYFGLLLQQQQIRNQEFNVRQQEALLKQFNELFARDRIPKIQVSQFESSLYQQQQGLLNAKVSYQDSLDRFKQQLGLPPSLEVLIEDPSLDGFKLIGDQISERLIKIGELRLSTGLAVNDMTVKLPRRSDLPLNERGGLDADGEIDFDDGLKQGVEGLLPSLKKAKTVIAEIKKDDRGQIMADINAMDSVRNSRTQYLKKLSRAIESGEVLSQVEPALFESSSIPTKDDLVEFLEGSGNKRSPMANLARAEADVERMIDQINSFEKLKNEMTNVEFYTMLNDEITKKLPDVLSEIDGVVLELSLLQAQARSNTIEISDVDIDSKQSLETARCLRRDWMNARAALVDNWRQIEFVADQLEAQVDIVFEGSVGNVGDNPFKLRYENGNLRGGLRFDAPIVRIQERNAYRQTLINYQQSRRRFYQFEDEINRGLRQTIRNINQNKILFELNRRSIQVNIENVEQSRSRLEQPPRPGQTGGFGDTTAQDLTRAINNLTTTQNQYSRAWVVYEVLRRNLDFDLGTMELDGAGEWVDPGSIDSSIGSRAAQRMGFEIDCRFCNEMGVTTISSSYVEGDATTSNFESGAAQEQVIYGESPAYVAPTNDDAATYESSGYEPLDEVESPPEMDFEPVEAPVPEPEIDVPLLNVPTLKDSGANERESQPQEYQSGKILLIGSTGAPTQNSRTKSMTTITTKPAAPVATSSMDQNHFLRPFSTRGRTTSPPLNAVGEPARNVLLTAAAVGPGEADNTAKIPVAVDSALKGLGSSEIERKNNLNWTSDAEASAKSSIPKSNGSAISLIPSPDDKRESSK